MISQIDTYFQRKVQHCPPTDDLRCWWDRVIQWIGPFLLLVGVIAMALHVNVTVRCSANGNIDLKALNTNAPSLQSTRTADFVNAQCSSQLGFPSKSFSGILFALAFILTLISEHWFRLPIIKSKIEEFKSKLDRTINANEMNKEIQRMESDPGATPAPDIYADLKKQHEELWQYRQCLEKKRFLGRFYLAKSVVQLVFSVLALVFSLFFAGWPPVHQGLFHCTLANVRADYVCTRTLGTWFIILNAIYAITSALYIAILVFGIVWYLKEGRKPYGLDENADKITDRQKSTNKPQEQVFLDIEGWHDAAFEGGNNDPVPRRPPDGEGEVNLESDCLLAEQRHVPKEVDKFHRDAAFMVRLWERNKSEEVEHFTRMMSRPLKEMLEGVVFSPDEIRIHHETIEDDDTVTVNLEWNGPLKGEYSGFRITVEKRTDGNFVFDKSGHVVKADVGKEKERTVCLRHLECGSVYQVRIFTVLEKEEGVIRTSQPSKIVIATYPGKVKKVELQKERLAKLDATTSIPIRWVKPKGNVDRYTVFYRGSQDEAFRQVPSHKESCILYGLTPGTKYTVIVTADCCTDNKFCEYPPAVGIQESAESNYIQGKQVQADIYTHPAKPTEMAADSTCTSIDVTWAKPLGQVQTYLVSWSDGSGDTGLKEVPCDTCTYTINYLQPGTKYTLSVQAKSNGIHSEKETMYKVTDPEEVGEIEVQTQEIPAALSWEPPPGNWESFRVSHWKYKKQDKIDEYTDKCVFALDKLEPGEKFFVEIATLVNGLASQGRTATFVTVPDMVSKGKVHVTEGIETFTLKWDQPSGRVDGYNIAVKQEDQESYQQSIKSPKPDVVINKIVPGTDYTIEIRSCSFEKKSEPCYIHLQKAPAPPSLPSPWYTVTKNTITLWWDLPQGKFERYQIFCKKDGTDTGTNKQLSAGNTYVLNDLQPSTHYTGWIRTLSKGKIESEHANFDCFTDPEPPLHFSCLKDLSETTTLTLEWEASRGDIEGYTLIISDTYGNETSHKLKPNITRYKVENLTPGMMYHCLVFTTSQAGMKSSYMECQTSTVPEVPKAEFITINFHEGAYVVCWVRPRGVFKHMSFDYFPTDSKKDLKMLTSKESPSPPLTVTPGTTYDLHAFVVTDHDKSDPCVMKFTTAPSKPVLFHRMGIETTSVSISWDPVQALCSYEVSCEQAGINAMNPETTTECKYIMMNLLPATKYDVKVATCVTDHKGELLKSDTSKRTIWTNPSAPTNFKQIWSQVNKKRQATSVKLKWEMPQEYIDHFEVIYDAQGVGRSPVNVECSRRTAKIVGLGPGTEYNCSISAILSNGQKSECATCVAFTAPAMPGTIVPGTIVAGTKDLYFQWMPAAGAVHKYSIMYRNVQVTSTDSQDDSNTETQTKKLLQGSASDEPTSEENLEILDYDEEQSRNARYEQIETVQSKCNVEKLDPGTNYEIRIFAITHGYLSQPQQLTQATKPGKPGKVTKEESTTAESISLSWGASEGNVSEYEIEYEREDRTTRQLLRTSTPNCIIDNISPGVLYNYKVYAISNGIRGDPSQVVEATDLPCPKNFRQIQSELPTRSIHLKWDAPESITAGSLSYTVKYRRFGTSEEYHNDRVVKDQSLKVTGLVPGRKYEFSLQVTGWKDKVGHSTSKEVFCTGATNPEPVHGLMWDSSSNRLTWEKPDGDIGRYDIKVAMGADIKTFHTTTCIYNVHTIEKGETCVFSVVAVSNEKTSKEISKKITIAPGNPEFVHEGLVVTTNSIFLHWNPPGGKVKHYALYHQPVDEDMGYIARWWSGGEKKDIVKGFLKTLDDLQPGLKYRFRVCAEVDGARDEIGDTIEVATKPEKPSIESDLSSKTLVLQFTCNGRKDCYKILYKCREDEEYQVRHHESKTKISTERMSLMEWQPGCVYDVVVQSVSYFQTDFEVKSEPVKLAIHTVPSKPTVRYEASATELTVKWVKVNEPGVDKITIKYWLKGDSTKTSQLPVITDVSATTASIHNVRPGSSYRSEVTFHCGDKSNTSGPNDIITEPVPPATVFHTQVSTSTANIEWERPDGQYDHMVVTLTNLTTNETKEKVTEELCTTYTRLRPATWYRMDVMTIKGSKRSAIRSHILNTAPLPPTGISVNPGANIAKIYWTYPDKRDDDGITFEINCWEVNARRPEPCLTASSKALETILKPLTPGSQYKVQVKAVFQETRNNDFKEALFSTEPPAVSNVQVQGFSTFADVSWRPPVEGKVKRYDIVFWRANNPSAKRKTTVQYPAVTGSIINLNQGTKYVAEVKSSVEGRVSQGGDRKTFYTVPSRPSMGNIDTAPDSIRLKWSRKEDEPDVTEAVVPYCLPGSTQKITKHVSTREPQQLLISPLNPNTHIEGYVELVSGDKTSDKTHWSATTDS